MKQISEIREKLKEIEEQFLNSEESMSIKNFGALEIPEIICSIVDYLQPNLTSYEAALYWHLFRGSILETGTQYTRKSTRGLMKGVVKSSSGQSVDLSYGSVAKSLRGLEDKGVITKSGDIDRDGTPFKIHLPEEIAICQKLMQETQPEVRPIDIKEELDYYNVRENRRKIFERDNYKCHYCKKQLTRFSATLDHIQPVSEGGKNSYDNLITACLHCNSQRGNKPVMDFVTEKHK